MLWNSYDTWFLKFVVNWWFFNLFPWTIIVLFFVYLISTGLNDLIPDNLLSMFDENELELLICGTCCFDLADLKAHHILAGAGPQFRKVSSLSLLLYACISPSLSLSLVHTFAYFSVTSLWMSLIVSLCISFSNSFSPPLSPSRNASLCLFVSLFPCFSTSLCLSLF